MVNCFVAINWWSINYRIWRHVPKRQTPHKHEFSEPFWRQIETHFRISSQYVALSKNAKSLRFNRWELRKPIVESSQIRLGCWTIQDLHMNKHSTPFTPVPRPVGSAFLPLFCLAQKSTGAATTWQVTTADRIDGRFHVANLQLSKTGPIFHSVHSMEQGFHRSLRILPWKHVIRRFT